MLPKVRQVERPIVGRDQRGMPVEDPLLAGLAATVPHAADLPLPVDDRAGPAGAGERKALRRRRQPGAVGEVVERLGKSVALGAPVGDLVFVAGFDLVRLVEQPLGLFGEGFERGEDVVIHGLGLLADLEPAAVFAIDQAR